MAATYKVSVERNIQQVIDGRHYKGYVNIADTRLDFELVFEVPIPHLESVPPAKTTDDARRFFQITVKRDDAYIELTNEEYLFFFSVLVQLTIDFYHTGSLLTAIGVSVSAGIKCTGTCNISQKLCEMLNAPKFGCAIAA